MVEEIIAGADIAEGLNSAVELPLSDAEDRRRLEGWPKPVGTDQPEGRGDITEADRVGASSWTDQPFTWAPADGRRGPDPVSGTEGGVIASSSSSSANLWTRSSGAIVSARTFTPTSPSVRSQPTSAT